MATWKKIIVSGSDAHLNSATASNSLSVGTNQIITTTQAGTKLTGSFTGSFVGNGTGLTGVTATATFPTTIKTDLSSTDKFFINDDGGNATSGNKQVSYGNLLTDLAGTNLAVESSDSLTLASTITGITSFQATSITGSSLTGSFTGSFSGNASGITTLQATSITGSSITGSFTGSFSGNGTALTLKAGIISGSTLSSNTQGTVTSSINGVNQNVDLGLKTTDSPTFNNMTLSGNANINGGAITTTTTATFSIVDNNATTVSIGTVGATTLNIGNSQSTASFNGQVVVAGDLTVNGTTTTLNTTNLLIEDKFALFASGSDTNTDGGIVVQQAASTGYALGVDASADRWALQNNASPTMTSIVPDAFMATIQEGTANPASNPVYGGVNGNGTLFINTNNGEIWIYS